MFGVERISSICRSRLLQHQQEARNDARDKLEMIERAAEPLSEEDEQRPFMVPRDRFAIDIWQLIMDKVSDPHEIFKLWEVSPLFREILNSDRKYIQVQLPLIVKIILDKRPWFLVLVDDEPTPENWGTQVSRSFSYLNAMVRPLRTLSRNCKNSVDHLLEAPESIKIYRNLKRLQQVKDLLDDNLKGISLADSPLLRRVKVDEELITHDELGAFTEAVTVFLGIAGKGIRSFWYQSRRNPQDVYVRLMDMMTRLPNLESLYLSLEFDDLASPRIEFEDLKPFTACPNLRSFTQIGKCFPRPYLRRIIEACPKLGSWEVQSNYEGEELQGLIHPPEMNDSLPRLECLRTPMHAMLLRHLGLQLPLKRIILQHHETGRRFTTLGLFTFLSQFKDTLEHVEFLTQVFHEAPCFLRLPHLKVFKWQCTSDFQDMRFLLHAGQLEEIEMAFTHRNFWTIDGEIRGNWLEREVRKGFDGFTIWQVFQQLKKVKVTFPMEETLDLTYKRNDTALVPIAWL